METVLLIGFIILIGLSYVVNKCRELYPWLSNIFTIIETGLSIVFLAWMAISLLAFIYHFAVCWGG